MSDQKPTYKIGTRGSLLALAQTNQVKEQLEKVASCCFEIVPIKTQGDLNTDAPLWQLPGENFFSKELDHALIKGDVDLVVHSAKDLGIKRPEELTVGAVTKRSYSHDLLIIRREISDNLFALSKLTIGSSSPRRIASIEKKIRDFLPNGNNLEITCHPLRGNVNTRLEKLQNKDFDAIVIALAGLERLANSPTALNTLQELLHSLNFMVLPESLFPTAAGQGALVVELSNKSKNYHRLREILTLIDHPETHQEVNKEKAAFAQYGGGCHSAVGVKVRKINDTFLHVHQGIIDGKNISKIYLEDSNRPQELGTAVFIGLPQKKINEADELLVTYDQIIEKIAPYSTETKNQNKADGTINHQQANYLVTSSHCLPTLKSIINDSKDNGHNKSNCNSNIWAAGGQTMKKLAEQGFWAQGSADSLGEQEIRHLTSSKALQIMLGKSSNWQWQVLTNDDSTSDLGPTLPAYQRIIHRPTESYRRQILEIEVFYWTSFFQYQTFLNIFPEIKSRVHCCGLGKTFTKFIDYKIKVHPFANLNEFKDWIRNN